MKGELYRIVLRTTFEAVFLAYGRRRQLISLVSGVAASGGAGEGARRTRPQ